MKIIRIKSDDCAPDDVVRDLAGYAAQDTHYTTLIRDESTVVYKPSGELLCIVVKNAVPPEITGPAWKALRTLRKRTTNRRTSTPGAQEVASRPIRKDGAVSNTLQLPSNLRPISNIIGYFDRNARFPYCRQTAFNMQQPEKFAAALPMIQAVDRVFAQYVPGRYAVQRGWAERTTPDFRIYDTAFTTITVNLNYPTAYHTDKGDLSEGFSCLTVVRAGRFSGGLLTFPKFRVAADLYTGDVILMDAHEWHGNTPIQGVKGRYERLACVLYYRTKMIYCGSTEEEIDRAKRRQHGEALHEDNTYADEATISRSPETASSNGG